MVFTHRSAVSFVASLLFAVPALTQDVAIRFDPLVPGENQPLVVTIAGLWPSSCLPELVETTVDAGFMVIQAATAGEVCLPVVTFFSRNFELRLPGGTYDVSFLVAGPGGGNPVIATETLLVEPIGGPPAGCTAGDQALCLNAARGPFKVFVRRRLPSGASFFGNVVPAMSDDAGVFWFFRPSNWELMVKVLDGCGVNGRVWVFAAATTNVEHVLHVEYFPEGGNGLPRKLYFHPQGPPAPAITDTRAFALCAVP